MLFFKKKKRVKDLDIPRLQLQVEMVQRLLDCGFSWEQIFDAIGFSAAWLDLVQKLIREYKLYGNLN